MRTCPSAHFPAPSPQHRILLDFLFLDTECTYDYLFVYDGDSPRGPLLASLSGSTRPPPIEASSGKVSGDVLCGYSWRISWGLGEKGIQRETIPGGTERQPEDIREKDTGTKWVENDKERQWGPGSPVGGSSSWSSLQSLPAMPSPIVPSDAAAPLQ